MEETSGLAELDDSHSRRSASTSESGWLVRPSRSELDVFEARLRVQIGFVMLSDLYRTQDIRSSRGIERDAALFIRAVLAS